MKNPFADHLPRDGWRQPRIRYQIGSEGTEDLERIRTLVEYRGMNSLYLEALKIGARILLEREIHQAPPAVSDEDSASANPTIRHKNSQPGHSVEVSTNSHNTMISPKARSQTSELASFAKSLPDVAGSQNVSDSIPPDNTLPARALSRAEKYSVRR